MDWIQQEPIENISLSRKSTIFAIAHLIDNPDSNPSLYLLHSLNLANRSGKLDITQERTEYLKLTYNFDQLDDLIAIGKQLIQNGLMTVSELDIIEVQLTTHGRQRVLFY
jgi:hypothetical protein